MTASIVIYMLALLAGAGLVVSGVYVLVGAGWALIASGVCAWTFAAFLRKGMTGD